MLICIVHNILFNDELSACEECLYDASMSVIEDFGPYPCPVYDIADQPKKELKDDVKAE